MAQIGKPERREDVVPLVQPRRVTRPEKTPSKPAPTPKRREPSPVPA
jgi:hypothetical protein